MTVTPVAFARQEPHAPRPTFRGGVEVTAVEVQVVGVEPQDAGRDGKLHELKIKIAKRKATIRGRTWITVPAK